MDIQKKAQDFLKSRKDVDRCLVTSDGNVFLMSAKTFAEAHARKIGDNKIEVVKKAKEAPKAESKPKADKKTTKSAKSKD